MKNGDLISREATLKDLQHNKEALKHYAATADFLCGYLSAISDFSAQVEKAPAVDAEPVIRCKDCDEYIPWGDRHVCGLIGSYFGNTKPNDFCSRGRRKKAGE